MGRTLSTGLTASADFGRKTTRQCVRARGHPPPPSTWTMTSDRRSKASSGRRARTALPHPSGP
eukprot:12837543-Alexandrium_andersonii.AAC.1